MRKQLQQTFTQIETGKRPLAILCAIIILFVVVELPELNEVETYPDYFDHVVPYLETCKLDEIPTRQDGWGNAHETRAPLKWWSLCFSHSAFGNERIIPFLYSIILIPVTYSFVTRLTQRKLAGLITVLVLVSSGTFTEFDTTATYEQSWVVFLMLSLIMVLRGSAIGMSIFFVLAVLSKPIALIYLPVLFAFVFQKPKPTNSWQHLRIFLLKLSLVIITIVMITLVLFAPLVSIGGAFEFDLDELLHGFYNWWFYLNASLLVAMTLPLVLWRLFVMRKKLPEAKPVIFAILLIIISVPLIDGLTNQLNHSYRFVPMIIFVGTGIAIIVINFVMSENKIFNIRKIT